MNVYNNLNLVFFQGDSLRYHNGWPFSTKDKDNDGWSKGNCAVEYSGAWWYKGCHSANLNGHYAYGGPIEIQGDGITWKEWRGHNYSLKQTEMKIRPYGVFE